MAVVAKPLWNSATGNQLEMSTLESLDEEDKRQAVPVSSTEGLKRGAQDKVHRQLNQTNTALNTIDQKLGKNLAEQVENLEVPQTGLGLVSQFANSMISQKPLTVEEQTSGSHAQRSIGEYEVAIGLPFPTTMQVKCHERLTARQLVLRQLGIKTKDNAIPKKITQGGKSRLFKESLKVLNQCLPI
ncbi:hypothetical protein AMTR_s00138p00051850 [Amborella trichopoda]|uniref:Uncharacterized protein n=1 Tax=Amborella trichopoda TaxID=13333 RepID=W1NEI0_AMBTC|nr:hypothetical protein AMTR_s00138p00051850 [Amborella trichopoda]